MENTKREVDLNLLRESIKNSAIKKIEDTYDKVEGVEDEIQDKLLNYLEKITELVDNIKVTKKTLKPKVFIKYMQTSKGVISLCVKYMIDHDGDEDFLLKIISAITTLSNKMLVFDGKVKQYNEKNKRMKENQYNTEELSEGKELPNKIKSYLKQLNDLLKTLDDMYQLLVQSKSKMTLLKTDMKLFTVED